MSKTRLELTWYNKDKALIPVESGKYDYMWVDPSDPRYCETHTLVYDEYVHGKQSPKIAKYQYSDRADLEPQEDNLLILGESGDVLEALTRVPELADKYAGKIKLVYIDPPFNTAKTFSAYEDNLEHSIWLTLLRDRLILIKRLLKGDGLLWLHIDDVEVHRVRLLLDEIFGSGNFLSEIAWEKTFKPRNDKKEREGFSSRHDMILVYSKTSAVTWNRQPRTASMDALYSNPDGDPNGAWTSVAITANKGDGAGGMCYAIQSPLTGKMLRPGNRNWCYSQEFLLQSMCEWAPYRLEDLHDEQLRAESEGIPLERVKQGIKSIVLDCPVAEAKKSVQKRLAQPNWPRIYITSKGGLRQKSYLSGKPGKVPEDWWPYKEVGSNDEAKNEIKALFSEEVPFDTPKPERLLERIIHISTNPGDIVLDCFAGSGTTAAVAQKMGRRWVTCELSNSNFYTYDLPRLTKVVNDEDPGGITKTKGERALADGVELPDGVTVEDAAKFTQVLNKLIDDHDEFKKDSMITWLKEHSKTKRLKTVINWRGGGGFQIAHLSPACFDYDEEYNRVLMTPEATGENLVRSVAANLGYTMLPADEADIFDARRGSSYLKVIEGIATMETVDWLVSNTQQGDTIAIAAFSVMDGVREYLRKSCKGSRVVVLPDDVFHYQQGGEDE